MCLNAFRNKINYSFYLNKKERKLRPDDIPYSIHVQNYNTNRLLFRMKKWYFNLKIETVLAKNNQTLQYLFSQVDIFSYKYYISN